MCRLKQIIQSKCLQVSVLQVLHMCSRVQAFKRSSVQVFKCSSVQVFKCSSVQVFKCSSVQVFKCSSVQVFKCPMVRIHLGDWLWWILWVAGQSNPNQDWFTSQEMATKWPNPLRHPSYHLRTSATQAAVDPRGVYTCSWFFCFLFFVFER
jgi:hypothetical protein